MDQNTNRLDYANPALTREEVQAGRRRAARAIAWTAAVAMGALAAGILLQVAGDPAGGSATARYVTVGLFIAAATATAGDMMAGLSRLTRTPMTAVALAIILVLFCFFIGVFLFELSPLRNTVGYIHGDESDRQLAINSALMRLWLCDVPVLMVGVGVMLLSRRREPFLWLAGAMMAGFLSALLLGWNRGGGVPRLFPMKWFKLASTALVPAVFVMLVMAVVRAWGALRRSDEPGPSDGFGA